VLSSRPLNQLNHERTKMDTIYQRFLTMLKTPTATELAVRELENAKRDVLEAQSAAEYAKHMVAYHNDRITRLTDYLGAKK